MWLQAEPAARAGASMHRRPHNTIGPISTLVNVNTIKISRSERAATIQLAGANVGLIKETLIACCQQHGIR